MNWIVLLTALLFGLYLWDFLNYPESIFQRLPQEILCLIGTALVNFFPLMHSESCSWQFLGVFVGTTTIMVREFVLTLLSRYVPFGKTLLILLGASICLGLGWWLDHPNGFWLLGYTLMISVLAVIFTITSLARRIYRRETGDEEFGP